MRYRSHCYKRKVGRVKVIQDRGILEAGRRSKLETSLGGKEGCATSHTPITKSYIGVIVFFDSHYAKHFIKNKIISLTNHIFFVYLQSQGF